MLIGVLAHVALAAAPHPTHGLRAALTSSGWRDVHCGAGEYLILCGGRSDGLVAQIAVTTSGRMRLSSDAVEQAQRIEGRLGVVAVVSRRAESEAFLSSLGPLGQLTASKADRWLRRAGLPHGCEAPDDGRVICRNAGGDIYVSLTVTPDGGPDSGDAPKRYARRAGDGREARLVINDLPASRALLDHLPPALEMVGEDGRALLNTRP